MIAKISALSLLILILLLARLKLFRVWIVILNCMWNVKSKLVKPLLFVVLRRENMGRCFLDYALQGVKILRLCMEKANLEIKKL